MKNYKKFLLLLLLTTVISFTIFAKANQHATKLPSSASGSFVKTMYVHVVDGGAR